jgi:hypothetical protein
LLQNSFSSRSVVKNKKTSSTPNGKIGMEETPRITNENINTALEELATTTADEIFQENNSTAGENDSSAAPQTSWSSFSGRCKYEVKK